MNREATTLRRRCVAPSPPPLRPVSVPANLGIDPGEDPMQMNIRMWVDGKPSTAFGALELADGQRIVVRYRPGQTLK